MAGISPDQIGVALERQLTVYNKMVTERVKAVTEETAKELVQRTKATAPVGRRGKFRKQIAEKKTKDTQWGSIHTWYVKAPDYRLTHLIVNGHQTRDGKRTRGNPFLANALAEVLPKYEKRIEEAVKND